MKSKKEAASFSALYRKYRPQEWSEVIGQEHVVEALKGARAMQRTINDSVERAIADKILNGSIRPGSRVELSPEELR